MTETGINFLLWIVFSSKVPSNVTYSPLIQSVMKPSACLFGEQLLRSLPNRPYFNRKIPHRSDFLQPCFVLNLIHQAKIYQQIGLDRSVDFLLHYPDSVTFQDFLRLQHFSFFVLYFTFAILMGHLTAWEVMMHST